jgi:predicted acylesterase/phospholipase RssA
LYDSGNLEEAIDECLGPKKDLKLKDLQKGLVVPAVDWVSGCTQVFVSGFLGKAYATDATLRELCLATSAAPTYFKPKQVDGAPMLDGGLSMNNPDVLALTEVARRRPERLAQLEMLSIGTTGADPRRDPRGAEKRGLAWAKTLPEYMMLVQERTASAQAARVLGRRYLRVNYTDGSDAAFLDLDVADDRARFRLLDEAAATATAAYRKHRSFIDRMLNRSIAKPIRR